MNIHHGRIGFTALLLSMATLFVFVANAEETQTHAPIDSNALVEVLNDLAADAGGDGDGDAGPSPRPAFDEQPFPAEKSPRPKKDEWKNAQEVTLSEGSASGMCKVQRLREWIRFNCPATTAQITLLCGNAEDVYLELGPVPPDWGTFPEGGEIVFAIRKGDRRLFEWQGVEFGYKGANNVNSFLVISELWLPGEEKPTIFAK